MGANLNLNLSDSTTHSDSSIWRSRRKLLTPAFHFKILENFVPVFARHTELLLDEIARQLRNDESEDNDHKEVGQRAVALIDDVRPLFEDLTLNIINGRFTVARPKYHSLLCPLDLDCIQRPRWAWAMTKSTGPHRTSRTEWQ